MKAQRAESTDATQELSAVYDYGFDRYAYPGDTEMQGLWTNTSLAFTGFYLAPAPDHSDTSWMGKRAKLKSMGWGFVVIYVGRQVGWSGLTTPKVRPTAATLPASPHRQGFPPTRSSFSTSRPAGHCPQA